MEALTDLQTKVVKLAQPLFEELELELVELKIGRKGKVIVFDFIADHAPMGLTMDECVAINRRMTKEFELVDILAEDWVVQVSSPGLDRPLKVLRDFKRVIGKRIWVQVSEKIDGKGEHQGELEGIDGQILVILKKKENRILIPFKKIVLGKQLLSGEE